MSSARAGQLIATLRESRDVHERDFASYELLKEVFHGYPFDLLVPLLHDDDPRMVESVAWILSELGDGTARYPGTARYMDEVDWLLGHPKWDVRFVAISSVLSAASAADGATVAKAVRLATDDERPVRSQVVRLLAYGSEDQLLGGLPNLDQGPVRQLLEWLLDQGSDPAYSQDIVRRLDDADELVRMFALAATVRVGRYDLGPIEHATRSSDEAVARFATLGIKSLAFLEKRRSRLARGD
jgi:hypothetical protein